MFSLPLAEALEYENAYNDNNLDEESRDWDSNPLKLRGAILFLGIESKLLQVARWMLA